MRTGLNNENGMFLTNIVPKVYEKVRLLQNEGNLNKMSSMQCAGRQNSPPINHIITLNAIIGNQRGK